MTLELVESPVRTEGLKIGQATLEDVQAETSLRPESLDQYIGQQKVVNNLRIFLKAALRRAEALDHVLLFGPPGLGKTSLAVIIANELGANLKTLHAPAVEKAGDLAAILTNLEEGDVLFIDEVHRLRPQIEEILYPAMEDFQLDIVIGQGTASGQNPKARSSEIHDGRCDDAGRDDLGSAAPRAGLGSLTISTFTHTRTLRSLFTVRRRFSTSRSRQAARWNLHAVHAEHRVSPIACCGVFETLQRSSMTAGLRVRLRKVPWTQWRLIGSVWMKLTASCF